MHYPVTFLFLCAALCVCCQAPAQDSALFAVHKAPAPFNWQQVEAKVPRQSKTAFIQQQRKHFPFYGDEYHPIDSLYNRLHFLDINGDGLNDVFYEGQAGGEGTVITLYINTGKTFEFIFNDLQHVRGMEWKEKKLVKLLIDDPGCCADYVVFEKVFTIDYNSKNMPVLKQIYQAASAGDASGRTYKGDSLFDKPFRFEVLNGNYKLRSEPFIDDSKFEPWDADGKNNVGHGNTIGLLPEGATGTALAKKTDDTGRVWWYVEIDEKYPLRKSVLYDNDNKFPTKAKGWLSSRFVRVIGR